MGPVPTGEESGMAATAQRFKPIRIPWWLRQASAPAARVDAFLGTLRRLGAIRGERLTDALMQSLFRGVQFEGKRVLDIGGGDGVYSFYAAARGATEAVCLEPEASGWIPGAANIFERIREHLPHLPVKLVPLPVAQYHDGAGFDIVAMICSINHLDEEACSRLLNDQYARQAYRRGV